MKQQKWAILGHAGKIKARLKTFPPTNAVFPRSVSTSRSAPTQVLVQNTLSAPQGFRSIVVDIVLFIPLVFPRIDSGCRKTAA